MSEIIGLNDSKLLRSDYVYDAKTNMKQSDLNMSRRMTILNSGDKTLYISTANSNLIDASKYITVPKGCNIITVKVWINQTLSNELYCDMSILKTNGYGVDFLLEHMFFGTPNEKTGSENITYWHTATASSCCWLDEDTNITLNAWSSISGITLNWSCRVMAFGY